jgi:hypothetical protein
VVLFRKAPPPSESKSSADYFLVTPIRDDLQGESVKLAHAFRGKRCHWPDHLARGAALSAVFLFKNYSLDAL